MDGDRWIKASAGGQDGFMHLLRDGDAVGVAHRYYLQAQTVIHAPSASNVYEVDSAKGSPNRVFLIPFGFMLYIIEPTLEIFSASSSRLPGLQGYVLKLAT